MCFLFPGSEDDPRGSLVDIFLSVRAPSGREAEKTWQRSAMKDPFRTTIQFILIALSCVRE